MLIGDTKAKRPFSKWFDCDKTLDPDANDEISVMGYSFRYTDFRYNAWFFYDRKLCLPLLDEPLYDEEVCSFHSFIDLQR
jgi:hypothetical protein